MTTPAPTWPTPAEPVGPAPGVRFAGHGARLGAYVIDAIIVGTVTTLLLFVIMIPLIRALVDAVGSDGNIDRGELGGLLAAVGPSVAFSILGVLVIGVFALLYFPFFWARGGATPGMKVAGIRVVNDRDGTRVGWSAALLRLVGWWVSGVVFYLGFVWILVDSRRRGWHDLIAGTCVISTR